MRAAPIPMDTAPAHERPNSSVSHLDDALSPFQRLVLGADGTVTQILEACAEEPVEAVKLHQTFTRSLRTNSGLDVAKGTPILRRQVLLRGVASRRNLLHASATLAVHRVPRAMLDALLTTSEPIGRLLVANRLETYREVLESGCQPAGGCGHHFDRTPADELLYRTYRVVRAGRPMMVITERFPAGGLATGPAPEAGGPETHR